MQALVYEGPRVMTLRDVDVPHVGPDDVLIRVAYSGICGSELSGFLGSHLAAPAAIGVRPRARRIGRAVGQRPSPVRPAARVGAEVTANPLVSCGNCRYCLTGPTATVSGAPAARSSPPRMQCRTGCGARPSVLLLPGMALREAATVEPAACAVTPGQLSGIGPDAAALVYGAGPIGLFLLQVLEQHGVSRRYVAELNPARLDMARALGAIPVAGPDALLEMSAGQAWTSPSTPSALRGPGRSASPARRPEGR